MALQTSPDDPAPVRTVSRLVSDWIGRLGAVWIDGQVAEYRPRPGARNVYLVLRDPDVDMSLTVVADVALLGALEPPLAAGQRVIVHARAEFWTGRGSLQFRAREIRPVGIGALLEQLERLKALLFAEGLFAPERKQPLPFLPSRVGLVCGRASAAMQDVIVNATARWPAVQFEIREVAVQGVAAVPAVTAAVQELDGIPEVDVIVIARGGGSVEDLLPFSNETLVRAVAACRTPVVSAIGHEQDTPLLDLVADLRASTPTDAAKRIVPSWQEQQDLVAGFRRRARLVLANQVQREQGRVDDLRRRIATRVSEGVAARKSDIGHLSARVRALSPAATLDRGYAIVLGPGGQAVRRASEIPDRTLLDIRVADGGFRARREDPGGQDGEQDVRQEAREEP
ncbi:MAG: exodeoxyribonuclease VII large subunit [Actinomycetales bacterium]|nr:exodeoxyribonuclease VII large subunit [Actinomycetales bacterium]